MVTEQKWRVYWAPSLDFEFPEMVEGQLMGQRPMKSHLNFENLRN